MVTAIFEALDASKLETMVDGYKSVVPASLREPLPLGSMAMAALEADALMRRAATDAVSRVDLYLFIVFI
jgi:hypothetical protein